MEPKNQVFIIPRVGALVRHPYSQLAAVPASGQWVELNSHWMRMINEGAVTIHGEGPADQTPHADADAARRLAEAEAQETPAADGEEQG